MIYKMAYKASAALQQELSETEEEQQHKVAVGGIKQTFRSKFLRWIRPKKKEDISKWMIESSLESKENEVQLLPRSMSSTSVGSDSLSVDEFKGAIDGSARSTLVDCDNDWLDEDELSRVRKMFRIPESKEIVDVSHCTVNAITVNRDMIRKHGTICLFKSFVCFFEYLPQSLKDMVSKEGFIMKRCGHTIRSSPKWHKYYFVLDNDKLAYYQNVVLKDSYTTVGVIPLRDIHSVTKTTPTKVSNGIQIMTSTKMYYLNCTSDQEADEWVSAIKTAIAKKNDQVEPNVTAIIPLKFVKEIRRISTILYPNGICVTSEHNEFVFAAFPTGKRWKQFYSSLLVEWDASKKGSLKKSLIPPLAENASPNLTDDDDGDLSGDSEDDDDDEHLVDQPSQSEKLEFQQRFRLPDTETLISVFNCAMLRSIVLQGKMYISTNYVCFYSRNIGVIRTVIIPFKDIVKIEKQKFQAHWLLNALCITTDDKQFHFGSFINRTSALDILHRGHKQALSGSFRKSKVMVSCDTESCSELESKQPQRSLKITMLIVGTRGDVQPFVALGLALEKAGHKVRIGTHEAHRAFVSKWGLDFCPLAGDPKQLLKLFVDNPNMFSVSFARDCLQFLDFMGQLLVTCWDAVKYAGGTDAIIQNPAALGGIHAAEKLGIPIFVAFTFPWTRTTEFPHPFAIPKLPMGPFYNYSSFVAVEQALWLPLVSKINAYRKEILGLPALDVSQGGSIIHDRNVPHLYCWSPSVLPKPHDWSDYICVSGYWWLPSDNEWVPPKDLVEFVNNSKPRPIYIGFGSVNVSNPDKLTRVIIRALIKTNQRAIVMKTWGGTENITKYPNLIYPLESAPHDWLFPRVSAVIHHGGAGTTAEGLRAGIPTMIVPFFGDQFLWASRIEELGVGIAPYSLKKFTTNRLSSAIFRLISDKNMQAKAAALGEVIRSQDGLSRAVEFFHRYFRKHVGGESGVQSVAAEQDSQGVNQHAAQSVTIN